MSFVFWRPYFDALEDPPGALFFFVPCSPATFPDAFLEAFGNKETVPCAMTR